MKETTIYQRAKTGKVKYITFWTEGAEMHRKWGTEGSKEQFTHKTCEGKNEGKANGTTASEQAILEMNAKIEKKCREGYSLTKDEILDEVTNAEIDLNNLPKAFCPSKPTSKMPSKIANDPSAYGQRKHNGHCIILAKANENKVYSRGMEDITEYMGGLPVVIELFNKLGNGDMVLTEFCYEDKGGVERIRKVANLTRKKDAIEVMNRYEDAEKEGGKYIIHPFDILFHGGTFVGEMDYENVRYLILTSDLSLPNVPPLDYDWKEAGVRAEARDNKWEGFVIRVAGEKSHVGYSLNGKADKKGAWKDVFTKCDDFIVTGAEKGTSGKQTGMYVTFHLSQYYKGVLTEFGNCGQGKTDLVRLQEITDEIDSGELKFPFVIQVEYRDRDADSGKMSFPQLELIRYDKKPEECTIEEF
jgi:predicted DNA-binding WGR domain protein